MERSIGDIKSFLNGAIQHGTNDEVITFAARMLNWVSEDIKPLENQYIDFYKEQDRMNDTVKKITIVDADEPKWCVKSFWFDPDMDVMMVNFKERKEGNERN